MKRLFRTLSVMAAVAVCHAGNADPAKSASDQQALRLVKEIQAQQITIAENQAKIDAKVAALAEEIRVARIFASRGGK